MAVTNQWTRREAEARIGEVLEAAKTGGPQHISEVSGSFELTFIPAGKRKVGELLRQEGPLEDGELDER
ncbi:hypothetical protein [Sinorhizobium meliloti]|uniref:hypothetical protein n=1 Tax=Rhizobium meliloti TaxID=382 RepID=UPI000FD9371C|nr:hypothetical protein [Sinorhizobium meliloti]RVK33824.1 hypothetical protein CN163_23150 [Sinorhizobium meliloti]